MLVWIGLDELKLLGKPPFSFPEAQVLTANAGASQSSHICAMYKHDARGRRKVTPPPPLKRRLPLKGEEGGDVEEK